MEVYVLFAGTPNQGILYVSQVFLEAATEGGWHANCLFSSTRGDVTQCLMVISDTPPISRTRVQPDVAVLASQEAADQLEYSVKPDGLLIMNASQVRRPPRRHDIDVVMASTDEENPMLAPVILLGVLAVLTEWTAPEHVENILQKSCKDKTLCEAFRQGVAYAEGIGGDMRELLPVSSGIWE